MTRKPIIFMLNTPGASKKCNKIPTHLRKLLWESQNIGDRTFRIFRKRRVLENPRDPFDNFLEILNMRSVFSRA